MKLGDILKELLDLHDMTQNNWLKHWRSPLLPRVNYVQGTWEQDFTTLIQIADYFQGKNF